MAEIGTRFLEEEALRKHLLAVVILCGAVALLFYETSQLTWLVRAAPLSDFHSDVGCDSISQIPQAECEALVALYNSTGGPNWGSRDGWLTSNEPCQWYGVTCAEFGSPPDVITHVVTLDLNENQLWALFRLNLVFSLS